jgi:hypothetical protein
MHCKIGIHIKFETSYQKEKEKKRMKPISSFIQSILEMAIYDNKIQRGC